ncbi:MAG: hypothetical protein C5B43_04530 [Verrucomicrobia bacterium]|nr:MAG: hypothetical protein C5B43_04530 [Verrucomicrobiota bacterium]
MKNKNTENLFERIKKSKKILYLDLGFLGDTIHQIPALNCIRKALPDVELHVMVADHIKSILDVTPWVDKVLGYPRFPKGPVWYKDIERVLNLRKEKYDVIINLNGSDRTSLLTWGIGAPIRLGRTKEKKAPLFWSFCFTDNVTVARSDSPIYRQAWECLKKFGFPGEKPEFNIRIPEDVLQRVDKLIDNERDFIHISPFTTQDYREVSITILAEFINIIQKNDNNLKIALSCAPSQRECERFDFLLNLLEKAPWRTFKGTALPPLDLVGLLYRSKLHIGGNSGALHAAFMAGTSTLSWFHDHPKIYEWLPDGAGHCAVIGETTPQGLTGITPNDLLNGYQEVVRKKSLKYTA